MKKLNKTLIVLAIVLLCVIIWILTIISPSKDISFRNETYSKPIKNNTDFNSQGRVQNESDFSTVASEDSERDAYPSTDLTESKKSTSQSAELKRDEAINEEVLSLAEHYGDQIGELSENNEEYEYKLIDISGKNTPLTEHIQSLPKKHQFFYFEGGLRYSNSLSDLSMITEALREHEGAYEIWAYRTERKPSQRIIIVVEKLELGAVPENYVWFPRCKKGSNNDSQISVIAMESDSSINENEIPRDWFTVENEIIMAWYFDHFSLKYTTLDDYSGIKCYGSHKLVLKR